MTERASLATAETVRTRTARAGMTPLGLFLRVIATAAAVYASVAAIAILVPDLSDYGRASVLKHERLATTPGRRIVLVGGSNLAYGIDSALLEEQTGCPAVNMGMNGYFGVEFMAEEVQPGLRSGDIVVVAFEWDNFYKSIRGAPLDLFGVVKANPPTLRFLDWRQRLDIALEAIPNVAQEKLLRFIRIGSAGLIELVSGRDFVPTDVDLSLKYENYAGFNASGDLVSHLGEQWDREITDGTDLTGNGIDPEVIGYIQAFARGLEARGVNVVISYSPILRSYYERHRFVVDDVHTRMAMDPSIRIPSPPADYVYEPPSFFDSVYHLNAEGRQVRTLQVVHDLEQALPPDALCGGQT